MKKNLLFLTFAIFASFSLNAQIFCPDDIIVSCLSDLTPDECGMATVVSGNYHPSMIKYVDQNETNACNEGVVYRRFYLDVDYSNTYSDNEPSCIQTITMVYLNLPLNVQFPADKEYTCVDEIPVDSPTWSFNPCDLVGYTYEDVIYEFEEGACLKIVRTYSVINWCVYDVDANEGLYEGIQIIKIVDNTPPEIDDCADHYFDTGENCETLVTLTNSASDTGDCPSGTLTWRVTVDLWGDGTPDLIYGPNEPLPYRLDPVENGGEIQVVIPEALSVSKHKVDWKVTDGCGNVRACSSEFFVEDNKPPTPYCINFTGATLNGEDGGSLVIPVSFFSLDALDNCSSKENITLSFSENVEDTERVIECGDAGFQFFRIYYTDEAGNQDFCEVFMIIFDNNSCLLKYAPEGMITKPDGSPINGATAYLMEGEEIISSQDSDESGYFTFGEQDLMEAYVANVKSEDEGEGDVDIDDFIMMRSALLGIEQLDFYQKVAADIDQNKAFDVDDLREFKDVLLGRSEIEVEDLWSFIPQMYDAKDLQSNLDVSESISYSQYNQGFDFYGVRTGDLTGSKMISSDEMDNGEEIELTLEITKNEITISAGQDFVSDAFQFDLNVYGSQLNELSSDESFEAIEDGQRFLNINSSSKIEKGQVLMALNAEIYLNSSIEEIVKSAKVFEKGALASSSIDWTFIDKRVNPGKLLESVLDIQVFPLPMLDRLNVSGTNITDVFMYSVSGQKLDVEISLNNRGAVIAPRTILPHGIYLLKVISAGTEKVIKVVK